MKPSELRALMAKASPLPWKDVAVKSAAMAELVVAAVDALPVHLDRIEALEAALREMLAVQMYVDDEPVVKEAADRARKLLEET